MLAEFGTSSSLLGAGSGNIQQTSKPVIGELLEIQTPEARQDTKQWF
jgi:hypothetical protein